MNNILEETNDLEYDRAVIDCETGEVLKELQKGDTYKLVRGETIKYLNSHTLNFNENRPFVKLYTNILPALGSYLTPGEFKFAILLANFASYEDCILRKDGSKKCKILDAKEIAEILHYTPENTRKFLRDLIKKGVVGKHQTGSILDDYDGKITTAYTVNPYIYFRGADVNDTVKSFYDETGWNEKIRELSNEE